MPIANEIKGSCDKANDQYSLSNSTWNCKYHIVFMVFAYKNIEGKHFMQKCNVKLSAMENCITLLHILSNSHKRHSYIHI